MQIQKINKQLRENAIENIKNKRERKKDKKPIGAYAASWAGEDRLYDSVGYTIFMVLPTSGCQWAVDSGGCTMCSYIADSPLCAITDDDLIEIFNTQWNKQLEKTDISLHDNVAVKLFVSGSFLNTNEISSKVQDYIFNEFSKYDNIKEVIVESKPEYIDEESLKHLASLIPGKIFEIGIGLETSNEETRLNNINKGITNQSFENAINTINSIKDYDIRGKAYLLIKPILLSEKDAINEAIDSAKYAKDVGVRRIAYCPATVHGGTLMDYLWKRGSYNPPWIWSTIKILKEVRNNVDIPMIMDTAGFGTRRGPFNCKKCNAKLKSLIIKSNLEQEIPEELETFTCECKDKWEADLEFSDILNTTTNPKA
ncbi:archaeosine biosynthesis radical SAM protein RaSEA [Methanosphaera cuniculi]|uniref:archaeosine biosynthesis radical SAM protein RaSEA n=1 Tax=Methanosphaera cuniculi TaxID=1077256 RepID=UPI0026DB9E49|nr:archaeosine biosynthesis radical SAM protein RaSEA [Methanosphaera cuniculi]